MSWTNIIINNRREDIAHPQWPESAYETLCLTNENSVKLGPTNRIGLFAGSMQVADSQDFPPAANSIQ